ncbi:MAG: hypothetical protein QOJ59_5058, partial [Thermomicrobiales bacterium]|nr:hypothetical protein [Thermomicrobiales bacterium]
QIVVRSQEALVTFLQQIAAIPGVRSAETFVMPLIIKPTTSWVLPDVAEDQAEEPTAAAETVSQDGQAADTPVKRKRGRPRRNPVPA